MSVNDDIVDDTRAAGAPLGTTPTQPPLTFAPDDQLAAVLLEPVEERHLASISFSRARASGTSPRGRPPGTPRAARARRPLHLEGVAGDGARRRGRPRPPRRSRACRRAGGPRRARSDRRRARAPSRVSSSNSRRAAAAVPRLPRTRPWGSTRRRRRACPNGPPGWTSSTSKRAQKTHQAGASGEEDKIKIWPENSLGASP